jgi:hypothetical protein
MTLLRAVGHVLHKVGGASSPEARQVIEAANAALKKARTPIFFDFIEDERNQILKTYQFSVGGNVTIGTPGGHSHLVEPLLYVEKQRPVPTSRFEIRPLLKGAFARRDPLEVLDEAVAFWRAHLDAIDAALNAPGKTAP